MPTTRCPIVRGLDHLNNLATSNKEVFVKRLTEEAERQKAIDEARLRALDAILQEFSQKNKDLGKEKENTEATAKAYEMYMRQSDDDRKTRDREITRLKEELQAEVVLRKKVEKASTTEKREAFIDEQLARWRRRSWIELLVCIAVVMLSVAMLLYLNDWKMSEIDALYLKYQGKVVTFIFLSVVAFVLSTVVGGTLVSKYRNHSNIKAYRETLKIPPELQ